jgi:hypothetical protein
MPGSHKPYAPVGLSAKEMRAVEDAHRDASHIVTRCAFCHWTYEGTALEGRELAKGHRRVHHPDVKQTRRRRGSLIRHVASDDDHRTEALERAAKVAASLARLEDAS